MMCGDFIEEIAPLNEWVRGYGQFDRIGADFKAVDGVFFFFLIQIKYN
jgi:hypothetical protein